MIHLETERLNRVKRSRDLNTTEWQRLIAVCDQYLNVPLPYGGHEQNYALAGLISGHPGYKNKAITLALQRCAGGYDELGTHGYGHWGGVRETVPAVAICYDWLCDAMLPSQRTTMETWLIQWGNLCWPETQPADKRDGWGRDHPGDNFYAGFMYASMAAGLALTGREEAINSTRAHSGQSLLDISRRRWRDELLPHKARYEPDGFPLEGSSYGVQAWSNLLLAKDAWLTVKGEDLWADASRLATQYLLHMTSPDMKRLILWGDNAIWKPGKGVNLMPLNDYVKLIAWVAQNHVPTEGSPTSFAWWLKNINPMPPGGWTWPPSVSGNDAYKHIFPAHLQLPAGVREHEGYVPDPPEGVFGDFVPPSPFHWLAWAPVLFARPEMRDSGNGLIDPLVSPGNGFAIACQGFQDQQHDTQLSFIAGPLLESHQDKAPGAVQIYKNGEMLIGSARHWWYPPDGGRGAEHHSTLLLPPHHVSEPAWKADVPEPLKRAHESIRITHSVEDDRYLYLEAEMAGAYAFVGPWNSDPEKWVRRPLKRWTRRILWHRVNDLFLFIDEVEKEPWAEQPVIAWQVRDKPEITPSSWGASVNNHYVYADAFTAGGSVRATALRNSYRVEVPTRAPMTVQALQITHAGGKRIAWLYDQFGVLGVTFGSGPDAVTLAVQMSDAPLPVRKRVYITQLTDPVRHDDEDGLIRAVRSHVRVMTASETLAVRSYLEDAAPKPDGELVLIGRAGA